MGGRKVIHLFYLLFLCPVCWLWGYSVRSIRIHSKRQERPFRG